MHIPLIYFRPLLALSLISMSPEADRLSSGGSKVLLIWRLVKVTFSVEEINQRFL